MEKFIRDFGHFVEDELSKRLAEHEEYQKLHKIYMDVKEKEDKVCYYDTSWTDDWGEDYFDKSPYDFWLMKKQEEKYQQERETLVAKMNKSIFRKKKYRQEIDSLDRQHQHNAKKLEEKRELDEYEKSIGYDEQKFKSRFKEIKKEIVKKIVVENADNPVVSMALAEAIRSEGSSWQYPDYPTAQFAMRVVCDEVWAMKREEKECKNLSDLQMHIKETVKEPDDEAEID